MMIRSALVNDLLDAITIAVDGAHHLRVERRLLGEAADCLDELFAQGGLALLEIFRCLQAGDGAAASIEVLLTLRPQISRQHLAPGNSSRVGLRDGWFAVGADGEGADEESRERNHAHGCLSVAIEAVTCLAES